ncbi:hypothetical protein BJV74DRAFT_836093 [Russula compacta]|nr:hypothetical protein BJV74DRAFT_836093 [Russula compacta]
MTGQDKSGSTPLHLASRGGHVRVARVLLRYGAHPTSPNNMNRTPYQEASAGGHRRTIQLLSNYEAKIAFSVEPSFYLGL